MKRENVLDDISLQLSVEAVAVEEHATTLWIQTCHHVDWDASCTKQQSLPQPSTRSAQWGTKASGDRKTLLGIYFA